MVLHGFLEDLLQVGLFKIPCDEKPLKSFVNNVSYHERVLKLVHTRPKLVLKDGSPHAWEAGYYRCARDHDIGLQDDELSTRFKVALFIIKGQRVIVGLFELPNHS